MFWNAYVVTALNRKSVVFFVAFVPQFVGPAGPLFMQFAILEATFVMLAAINAVIWALLAGQICGRLQEPWALRLVQRIGRRFSDWRRPAGRADASHGMIWRKHGATLVAGRRCAI